MIYNQEYITTELQKTLVKMIPLTRNRLINLVAIIIGIIDSKTVVLSKISEKLKDDYSTGTETSKVKRLERFLKNNKFDAEFIYYHFVNILMKRYKNHSNKIYIIFDHTTIKDKFLILKFSLKIGRRGIPIWFKMFKYKEKNNKSLEHVKQGLIEMHSILRDYNYEITLLADRGFKSIDLFRFIDETLCWKYCTRCTKDVTVEIEGKKNINKLEDIKPQKNRTKHFKNVKLTAEKYVCNLAVCKAEDADDTWVIINNLEKNLAVREYKKRFDIEEMFKDMKSGGFNLEETWTKDLTYAKNLFLCVCIAYSWMVILGVSCGKDKKNKLLGTVKKVRNKVIRVYSLF